MIGYGICLAAMVLAPVVALCTARHLPGDFRIWAGISGLLLGAVMVVTNPHNLVVGLLVGAAYLFCITVAICREPTRKALRVL